MDLKRWFKLCFINILLLFFTIDVVLSKHTCVEGIDLPGYTIPSGDISIEYGNPLDITCVVYNTNKLRPNASHYLTFFRNNGTLPSDMIEILNSTAIKLHIAKPPKVQGDSYACQLDNKSVCMNIVSVGNKPQKVEDFNCIGYNFDNLTCTWTPPNNYVRTYYNLTYRLPGRSSRSSYQCPSIKESEHNSNDKRMSCVWNISTTPPYRQVHEQFVFTLKMMNTFGETVMPDVIFSHFAHVLSGPPENLTVVSRTPSSIYLYWVVPTSMQTFPSGVHHRILYQCVRGDKKWHFGGEITNAPNSKDMYFNLTDLKYANTLCDIRVSLRSAKAIPNDESMWSKNASITVLTASKIPDEPPKTNVGSFEIVVDDVDHRQVYIYWQQIPDEQKNGPDFKYDIEVEGRQDLYPVNKTNSYAKFTKLLFSNSYKFNIWSSNLNGSSLRKSSIVVPKRSDQIKGPQSFTKVEFGGGKYELTWEAPELPQGVYVTNYTIFWCSDNRDRPHQCKGQLDWAVLPSTERSYNATVPEEEIFQFAISANSERGSSGMVWAACTIIHNKHMGRMKNVWINTAASTSIDVGWQLDCSDRIGSVVGFTIYYCPIVSLMEPQCKDSQKNQTFYGDDSVKGGIITNLTPYTTYGVSVAVITKHTTYSQPSEPLYATTLEDAPSVPEHLRITNITNSTISLAWNSPISKNGLLRYYNIKYHNRTGPLYEQKVELNNATIQSAHNYTLSNLESYVDYDITVQACTNKCSNDSMYLRGRTKVGYPGKIKKPTVDMRNDTAITIIWSKPAQPNGKNEYYVVQLKKKRQNENTSLEQNVTEQKYVLENCGDGGEYNTFYVAVRAVNVVDNISYFGPWSDALENYCFTPVNYLAYILSFLVIVFFFAMAFLFNRLYKHCKIMRDVEVKLPPGLAPVIAENSLVAWNTEKHQENRDSRAPPDEELLLVKMKEGRHLSGDSSGCSSGHESVTSSLDSGTHISSSSDSGTEQPGSYSVLGVDPKADSAYVPVTVDSNKVPYKTCDVSTESSPYVMTGDAVKTINPGYIPFNQNETIGKSSGYVVAGIKNCNGYIPFNQTETVNRNTGYVVAGIKNCKLD